ncbi:MAG: transcription antitermination factor NusB, partial [Verrucomicrobiota bacterium]|nr:transcription antitermination factor NusB [Verrucomicrobiota bacterium]
MTRRSGHHTPVVGGKPRQIALDTLLRSQRQQAAAERLLADTFREAKLSSADAGLARELVSGCVRWRRLLDWLIERATDGREQKPAVQEILRLGLYQIFFLNRIPDHAIA